MKKNYILAFLFFGFCICFLVFHHENKVKISPAYIHEQKQRGTSVLLHDLYEATDPFMNQSIDSLKVLTMPSEIDQLQFIYYSDGIFCIYTGDAFGFIDKDGNQMTPSLYDNAYPFQDGLACVMKDGKYGFLNKEGGYHIPLIYDKAAPFSEGLAYFESGDTYGFINQNGEEVILLDCDSISSFCEGRALFSRDGKYGFIDKSGQEVIPSLYDDAYSFRKGLSRVRKGITSGVIDLDGKEVIPLEYDTVELLDQCIRATKNDEISYFNYWGKEIHNPENELSKGDKKYRFFQTKNGHGIKDHLENVIISPVYDSFTNIENTDFLIACKNNKYGIIDINETILVPFLYDYISLPYYENNEITDYVEISLDSKRGILRLSDFTVTIPPTYSRIETFHQDHAIVYSDEEYGLVNKFGRMIIPLGKYDTILSISDKVIALGNNEIYQLAKYNGELLSNEYYYDLNPYSKVGSYHEFSVNKKTGLLDSLGNEILPPSFHFISDYPEMLGSNNCFVATNYDSSNPYHIIVPEQIQETEISDLFLTNQITPKLQAYHNILLSDESKDIKTIKLYRVDGISKPILYYYTKPAKQYSFPESNSKIYGLINNQLTVLAQGNECGGSMRGNYVELFLEKNTGKTLLGTSGFYGGFRGYYSDIYMQSYEKNKLIDEKVFYWIGQDASNFSYDDPYLLDHAAFFYDSDDLPHSKETILQSDYMQMYTINKKMVSMDEYHKKLQNYLFLNAQTEW